MFIHGNNLEQKEKHKTKYLDEESKQYLSEIRLQYDEWKSKNEALVGPNKDESENDSEILSKRVEESVQPPL